MWRRWRSEGGLWEVVGGGCAGAEAGDGAGGRRRHAQNRLVILIRGGGVHEVGIEMWIGCCEEKRVIYFCSSFALSYF